MPLSERISHAVFGAVLGALVGLVGWWLYGLGHSLRFNGPGIDPVLRHWVQACALVFGIVGAAVGPVVMDAVSDVFAAILNAELDTRDNRSYTTAFCVLVVLLIALAIVWFTAPRLLGGSA